MAILVACLIEQLNLYRGGFDRAAELARLAAVPAPPTACQIVLTVNAGQRPLEIEAIWNALRVGLPTLNGYSGWSPPGWRLGDASLDYFAAAREWIARSAITKTVCLYDQATRSWSPFWP